MKYKRTFDYQAINGAFTGRFLMFRKSNIFIIMALFFLLTFVGDLSSGKFEYKILDLEGVSRYNEDRIAFQSIQLTPKEVEGNKDQDNSIACLLIIKDRKMYLLKDGYDMPEKVNKRKFELEADSKMIGDVWGNKIDDKPDYIRIMERRIELLKKIDSKEDKKLFVEDKFSVFYKNMRDEFIKKHVDIFRALMVDRKESGLYVERKPIPKRLYVGSRTDEPIKFATIVSGKTIDEKQYYAEDADGDGITETFWVNIPDGFNWGYKSGPNIIFILQNKDPEIQKLIQNITNDAYYGTENEAKYITDDMNKTFKQGVVVGDGSSKRFDDKELIDKWINLMYPDKGEQEVLKSGEEKKDKK